MQVRPDFAGARRRTAQGRSSQYGPWCAPSPGVPRTTVGGCPTALGSAVALQSATPLVHYI